MRDDNWLVFGRHKGENDRRNHRGGKNDIEIDGGRDFSENTTAVVMSAMAAIFRLCSLSAT